MHNPHRLVPFAVVVLLNFAAVANAQTVTLDFNGSNNDRVYTENGFELRSNAAFGKIQVASGFVQNRVGTFFSSPIRVRQISPVLNGTFTLNSVTPTTARGPGGGAFNSTGRFVTSKGVTVNYTGGPSFDFTGDAGFQDIEYVDWFQTGGFYYADRFVLTLGQPNQAPTCTASSPSFLLNVGQPLLGATVTGTDPDGDPLTLTTSGVPPGATVLATPGPSTLTATLNWTPTITDLGANLVTFDFRDPSGELARCTISVNVVDIPPTCDPDNETFMINIGEFFPHTVTGTDPDPGDTLTVTTLGKPSAATVSPTSGSSPLAVTFNWTPTVFDVGQHDVTMRFTDAGGVRVDCVFMIFVENRVPTCSPDGEMFTLNIGEPLAFTIAGADVDPGDDLTVSHSPLPGSATVTQVGIGANVDADFAWTPSVFDVGIHAIDVTFTDINGAPATCSFDVEVINRTPECEADIGDPFIGEFGELILTVGNDPFTATFTGTDPDPGDVLTLESSSVPVGATFTPATATGSSPLSTVFAWAPTAADVAGNPHLVGVEFVDINGAANGCVLEIVVNRPPVCDAGGGPTGGLTFQCDIPAGHAVTLNGSATDPDPEDAGNLTFVWDVSDLSVVLDNPNSATATGIFPVGVTMATLTVADGRGGVDVCDVVITVEDTVPPEVMCTTNVAALWPPKHNMVNVDIIVTATDDCTDPEFIFPLTITVSSDEVDDANGNGDGNTTGDVNGQDGFTAPVDVLSSLTWDPVLLAYIGNIQLRAEREGTGDGRKYTIDVVALDSQGNAAITSCCIVVPHDRRGGGGNNN